MRDQISPYILYIKLKEGRKEGGMMLFQNNEGIAEEEEEQLV